MPLQINLLAEQQLAEEMRRRDPVKRGYWVAGFAVALVLLWGLYLQMKIWAAHSEAGRFKMQLGSIETKAGVVRTNMMQTSDVERRLLALNALAVNRPLWGPVLDALQFSVVPDIQFYDFKVRQSYAVDPGVKAEPAKNIKRVPAKSTERISLVIEAKCYAADAQDQIFQFRRKFQHHPNFKGAFTNDNSVSLNVPSLQRQPDLNDPARSFVKFSLEGNYPEKVRKDD